jgi:predicted glycosyl hydrolase (DUF1957 family)
MLYWIDILHLYQPPTQSKDVVDMVVAESYRKILELLQTNPNLHLTINLSGSLIELLEKYHHHEVIRDFKTFVKNGQVELLGSAMYHPILPLLPEKEINRQITLNSALLTKHFGQDFIPRGFYIPEMAYGEKIVKAIRRAGFSWIILDEIHSRAKIDFGARYLGPNGLGVIFRNSALSRTFPPEFIETHRSEIAGGYLVTAHDGELYGHWHKDDRGYYKKVYSDPEVATLTASEYLARLGRPQKIYLREANWESTPAELAAQMPYGLWQDPANDVHKKLDRLKRFALRTVEKHKDNPRYAIARDKADKGVASCAWWWASERVLGPFSPLTWNPDDVEKGANQLLSAVRSLKNIDPKIYLQAERYFNAVHGTVWELHWKKHPNA